MFYLSIKCISQCFYILILSYKYGQPMPLIWMTHITLVSNVDIFLLIYRMIIVNLNLGSLQSLRGNLLYFHMFDTTNNRWGDIYKIFNNGSKIMIDEGVWWKHSISNMQFTNINYAYYYRRFYTTKKVFI